jgi:hypothetical protein
VPQPPVQLDEDAQLEQLPPDEHETGEAQPVGMIMEFCSGPAW